MKSKIILRLCVFALVIALLMVGCASNQVALGPSDHNKLVPALGLSKEEACKVIGIEQEQMTEFVIQTYSTPLKAELAGQTFEVILSFDALSEKEELLQIVYRAIYADQSDTTAQAVKAVVETLEEQYGEPSRRSNSWDETAPIPEGYTYWDLTETVSQELSAYMKQLEEQYGGSAYYQLSLQISLEENECVVTMKYVVGVNPA